VGGIFIVVGGEGENFHCIDIKCLIST